MCTQWLNTTFSIKVNKQIILNELIKLKRINCSSCRWLYNKDSEPLSSLLDAKGQVKFLYMKHNYICGTEENLTRFLGGGGWPDHPPVMVSGGVHWEPVCELVSVWLCICEWVTHTPGSSLITFISQLSGIISVRRFHNDFVFVNGWHILLAAQHSPPAVIY